MLPGVWGSGPRSGIDRPGGGPRAAGAWPLFDISCRLLQERGSPQASLGVVSKDFTRGTTGRPSHCPGGEEVPSWLPFCRRANRQLQILGDSPGSHCQAASGCWGPVTLRVTGGERYRGGRGKGGPGSDPLLCCHLLRGWCGPCLSSGPWGGRGGVALPTQCPVGTASPAGTHRHEGSMAVHMF